MRPDGCPECVANVEPPRSEVATADGVRCAYLCTDCGHAWTTDWKVEKPCDVRVFGFEHETMGTQSGPESAGTDRGQSDWIGVEQ